MNLDSDHYEDEIDRIRIRSRKKKKTKPATPKTKVSEDTGNIEFAKIFEEDHDSHSPVKKTHRKGHGSTKRNKQTHKKMGGRLILLVLLIATGVMIWSQFHADGWWTVAVFGLDSRDGNLNKGALSDVEMLCSVNKKSGEIRLLSVFRDTYVRIDEDDYDKINEAYFLGGPEGAVNALETNFDLSVDDYASFNWKAVVDALNVLGGVDIEISDSEFAYINSFITETVESTGVGSYQLEHSGLNHLDGVQAVAYARLRLMDTDFQRTERQRKVLGLAMEKIRQADTGTLTTLAGTVFPQIATSIGIDDILQLAKNAKKYYISETSGFPFSHEEIYIGKKSCVVATTLQSNVIQLHEFLYSDTDYTPSAMVSEISSAISEISGLSEPGKDQESGKNVGAQGNTGEQQSVQSTVSETEAAQNADTKKSDSETSANPNSDDGSDRQPDSFMSNSAEAEDNEDNRAEDNEDNREATQDDKSNESKWETGSDSGESDIIDTLNPETSASQTTTTVPDLTPTPGTSNSGSSTTITGQEHPVPESSSAQTGPSTQENKPSADTSANTRLQAPGNSRQSGSSQPEEISPGVSP